MNWGFSLGWCGVLLVVGCGQAPERKEGSLARDEARLTAPTQINGFALLASGRATLQDRTAVTGGHIGVAPVTGDSLTAGFDAKIGLGRSTLAQRTVLKDRAAVGDLFANTVVGPLGTYASLSPYAAPPAPPPIVSFAAGTTPVTVNTPSTLAAGNYGLVTVNSTLTLSGGTYQIQNLTLATNAVVQASAATIVRVAGRVSGGNHTRLAPTGAQPAGNFRLIVAGPTDTNGGVVLGTDATVTALIVSLSSFSALDRLVGSGAIAGRNISMGLDSKFAFGTGFECNSDTGCNDNNACTTDTCVDAKCIHQNVANGTACPDEGNVCTLDQCQAGVCTHPARPNGTACTSDNNVCTNDQCQTGQCAHPPVANGTPCTDDNNACTTDACSAGTCAHPAVADNTACPNEGNPCTNDLCQAGLCAHPAVPNGTLCFSDGQECTNDVCAAGVCAHPALSDGTPCRADLLTCTADECLGGLCSHPPVPDGTHCDNDDNACTADICASGGCAHPIIPEEGSCGAASAVIPLVECVLPLPNGHIRAVFGYENTSSETVRAAGGIGNEMSPSPGMRGQPIVFRPGRFDHAFAADFVGSSLTWKLGGENAVATTSSPACDTQGCSPACGSGDQCVAGTCVAACGDSVCAGEDCESCPIDCGCDTNPRLKPVERPDPIAFDVASGMAPDITTRAFTLLPAPTFGGHFYHEIPQGAGTFSFHVDSLNWHQGEGACGTVDPYVKKLILDGQDLGQTDHGSVLVSRTHDKVRVHVEVYDSDGGLCFGDEKLAIYDFDVDNYQGGGGCSPQGGGSMCWTATGAQSPDVCFAWYAQFIDAGPWDSTGSEDFLNSKGIQPVPASYARLDATISRGGHVFFEIGQFLDERGCIRKGQAPPRELWEPGGDLIATFRLSTQHCLNPGGNLDCAIDSNQYTGANVITFPLDPTTNLPSTGPASVCTVITDDPSLVTDPSCLVMPVDWTGLPPNPIVPTNQEVNPATRTAAVIGHIFARETATNGALGVKVAMIDRRLTSKGRVDILVDKFCCLDDTGHEFLCTDARVKHKTSCSGLSNAGDPQLELEPDNVNLSGTRLKYVIAHEFGHFIQSNAQGLPNSDYSVVDPTTLDVRCGCALVPTDDALHCLQSVEEPNSAQVEGFGQYFASSVFNDTSQADCTFVYYKNFGDDACRPGVSNCTTDMTTGLTLNPPPIPVNCVEPVRWRNTHCLGGTPGASLFAAGTEYDWLEFLYGIGQHPSPTARWGMVDLFDAYRTACNNNDPHNLRTCTGPNVPLGDPSSVSVSWAGDPTATPPVFSLLAGATAFKGEGSAAAAAFQLAGDTYGVSNR